MPWLQLRIDTSREQASAIEDAVLNAGAVSVTLEDNADQPIFEPALGETPLWQETRVTGLFDAETDTAQVTQSLETELGGAHQARWHILEDKDWEREWMQHYHPIQCGEKFWICPSWLDAPDPDAVNLKLDPGLAFGTGTHPTTFLCLQWLAEQEITGSTVVDYGCGSGILGVAALLLGARSAVGVDIDPQALLASRDNAARNGLPPEQFPVYLPSQYSPEPADVVVANILAGPLVELAPVIGALAKPGGQLCLSGILEAQAEAVMDAYRSDFDFVPVKAKDGWVRLTAIKKVAS
jgi:ribosomal protein L11 methyltransferase